MVRERVIKRSPKNERKIREKKERKLQFCVYVFADEMRRGSDPMHLMVRELGPSFF